MRYPIITSALAAAALTVLPAAAAHAGQPKIEMAGEGQYELVGPDAIATGTIDGRPFSGNFTLRLRADDGTFPAPDQCEDATATLRVTRRGRTVLDLRSTGTVCGENVQPPFIAIERYTGRYQVVASKRGGLIGSDGFIGIALSDRNTMGVELFDS